MQDAPLRAAVTSGASAALSRSRAFLARFVLLGHCQRPTGTGFKRTFFPLPGSLGTNGRQPPRGHLHRFEVSEKPKDN